MKRFALTALSVIALAGEWVSTPGGQRVCQLAYTLEHGMVLTPDFCMSWQAPFYQLSRGEPIPFRQGWIRRAPNPDVAGGRWGTLQIHIEGKGWVP